METQYANQSMTEKLRKLIIKQAPTATNGYRIHQFEHPINVPQNLAGATGWTRLGFRWEDLRTWPFDNLLAALNLHSSQLTFGPRGTWHAPPWEVISWHYLQCVLHAWGQSGYKGFTNIRW